MPLITSLKKAEEIAGKLSKPSKMPGYAYGLPAQACITGSRLAKLPGTVCSSCYALKGRYIFPNVKNAQKKRLESITHPLWVDAICYQLEHFDCRHFRWHDSGDIQSLEHLDRIVQIAQRLPQINFWLPTREKAMVSTYTDTHLVPVNLVIRVSGTMIDGHAPVKFLHTSTVTTKPDQVTCPAPLQDNQCGTCRACWDPTVSNISYRRH